MVSGTYSPSRDDPTALDWDAVDSRSGCADMVENASHSYRFPGRTELCKNLGAQLE